MAGGTGDDELYGASGKDRLAGGGGADTLDGGTGNDIVLGEDGDDAVILDIRGSSFANGARQEMDTLEGGTGNDTLVIRLTNAQSLDPAISNALTALQTAINAGNATAFTSTALGIKATSFSALQLVYAPLVNIAPNDITLNNARIAENASGAVVGNLTGVDSNIEDSHSFTVDDSRFETIGNQLKLKAGQKLNFESEPMVTLHITATDSGGLSYDRDIVIDVTNANEALVNITLDAATVVENASGAIIGNLATADIDAGDTHIYAVNDARFEIVAGQLKLKAGQSLDFESATSVTVRVTSTDQGGLSLSKDFVVTVTDTADLPLFSAAVNNIDFSNVPVGVYDPNLLYNSLAGNDIVRLPDAARAALLGYVSTNTFSGGDGNDTITGNTTQDTISGGIGDDKIYGGIGNDTLDGSGGDDTLTGDAGNDTFVYSGVFGNDLIENAGAFGEEDVISFIGINPATVTSWSDLDNIYFENAGGTIRVHTGRISSGNDGNEVFETLSRVIFDDVSNTVWDFSNGLYLRNGNTGHPMHGSAGADTLIGGLGNDTFVYSGVFGNDLIENANAFGEEDVISFIGINPATVTSWSDLDNIYFENGGGTIRVHAGRISTGNDGNEVFGTLSRVIFDDAGNTVWDFSNGLYFRINLSEIEFYILPPLPREHRQLFLN